MIALNATSIFERMPSIVGARLFELDKGKRFSFPLHNHYEYSEFLLIVNGEGSFQIDGERYETGCGHLLCYNRSIWHEEKSISDTFHAMYIGFKGLQLRSFPPDFFLERDLAPIIELKEHFMPIKQLFHEAIMEFKSQSPESITLADQLLGALMCHLSRLVHYEKNDKFKKNTGYDAVLIAKRYIEEHYQTNIDLNTLAKLSHITPYHFSHLFKQETGISPIQHLINYRMELSKQYLVTTQRSMEKIAELVGYKSETYFHNIFKKVTGMSPGQYRSEYQRG
jgi:AraC-like DNA-binding protein